MDEQEKQKRLIAYADGELEGQEKLAAQEQIVADPQAAEAVAYYTKLREAVAKSVKDSTPSMPAHLRDSITQLAQQSDDAPVIGRIGPARFMRWAPAMAAAVLVAASVVIFNQSQNQTSPGASTVPAIPVIAMNKADSERFSQRHAACTSMRELLHQADWPTNVNELPVALTGHLGASPYKGMDLSKAGYKFDGAGPCMAPGEPSAHLIYRPVDDQNQTPISLWLRPDDGRYDIPENMTHQVNTEGSSTPIYIWRHSGIIYYMVGDSMSHVMEAKSQFAD